TPRDHALGPTRVNLRDRDPSDQGSRSRYPAPLIIRRPLAGPFTAYRRHLPIRVPFLTPGLAGARPPVCNSLIRSDAGGAQMKTPLRPPSPASPLVLTATAALAQDYDDQWRHARFTGIRTYSFQRTPPAAPDSKKHYLNCESAVVHE